MKINRFTVIFIVMIMVAASLGSAAVFAVPYQGQYYSQPAGGYYYNPSGTYSGYGLPGSVSVVYTGGIHSHVKSVDGRGGISRISTFYKEQQAADANAFYVDAGNFSMGTTFQAAFMKEALELRGLAAAGCDVTTIGVSEFDYGLRSLGKMLKAAKKKSGSTSQTASGTAAGAATGAAYTAGTYGTTYTPAAAGVKLPYIVCSNIDWDKTLKEADNKDAAYLKKAMKDYGVNHFRSVTKGTRKIAVIGITGEKAAAGLESKGIYFEDPVSAAKDTIKKLKKKVKDVDMIVCLGQFGAGDTTGEAERLAEEVKDIDLIVIGDSSKGLKKPVKAGHARIVSAGADSRLAGAITFTEKTAGKKDYRYTKGWLKKLDKSVAEDAGTKAEADGLEQDLNDSYFEKHGYKAGQKLAENGIDFSGIEKFRSGSAPDPFGDLLVDSYFLGAKETGDKAVVAIASTKSIDRVLPKGELTVDDTFNMSSERLGPDGTVGSALVRVYFTGKDLKNIAEAKVSVIPKKKDMSFYISGIRYSYNTHRVKYNRVFKVTDEDGNTLKDGSLYPAVCDLEFLGMVSDISDGGMGMIPIEIRDKDGKALPEKKWESMTIEKDGAELKIWQAVADKLDSFDGKVPGQYAKARSEADKSESFSPSELFKAPNRAGWISYCIALVIILVIVLVIILLVSRRRRSYASRVRRESKMFRNRRHGSARKAYRKSQKKIFSNKKNRRW